MEKDGVLLERPCGTPQGGVISPLLSNLFLHYAFDLWIGRVYPDLPWCRYADDGLVHCRTEQEAQAVMASLKLRLAECGLEMHPTKTKIVYCKDATRRGQYPNVLFDFLGYQYRPRMVARRSDKRLFCNFTPAVSPSALKSMRSRVRDLNISQRTSLSLADVAKVLNPIARGWIEYYGRYSRWKLESMALHVNRILVRWATRKFKRFKGNMTRAKRFFEKLSRTSPRLFEHWRLGVRGAFA